MKVEHWDGEYTYKEIAEYMGLSTERVRQLESSAIKKLKHPKYGGSLKRYLNIENVSDPEINFKEVINGLFKCAYVRSAERTEQEGVK